MNLLHNKTEKDLKNLYLKYKKKYLNLKHQLGGDHYLYIIEDKKKHRSDPENSIILDIDKKIKEEFLKFIEHDFPRKLITWKSTINKLIITFKDKNETQDAKKK